jgi:aminopeptidase N
MPNPIQAANAEEEVVMSLVDTGAEPAADQSSRRSTNLTREDARERARVITKVESYDVVVDVTDGQCNPSTDTFRSKSTVTFTATKGGRTFIDITPGESGKLHSATLNEVSIDVSNYGQDKGIPLIDLAENNTLTVEADCTYSHDGEGLYRFEDTDDGEVYLYTHFEPAAAKRVFACFDQPDLKASFSLTVIAPRTWVVVSNTTADTEDGQAGTTHRFAKTAPMSTYLVALIAGPYASWSDIYTGWAIEIPLRLFCRKSLQQHMDAENVFHLTKQGFMFYHDQFGVRYPFGKYDQVFCPDFNPGAMENVAAVTFSEESIFRGQVTRYQKARRAETLLHEMAHMWFGDLVTMKWWDDLWLNEAFATWAANMCLTEATEFVEAWTTFANVEKPKGYRKDELKPTTHAVAAPVSSLDDVEAKFDPITYIKGASVLKQLVAYVGRKGFLTGLHDYFTSHTNGNAELTDLLTALQSYAPDRDLRIWADEWLMSTGLNTLSADLTLTAGDLAGLAVVQSGAEPGTGETRHHRIQIGVYDDDKDDPGKLALIQQPVTINVDGPRTEVPELKGARRGKLILLNHNDDTYCSLALDNDSLKNALAYVGDIAEPLARAQVWSIIWEMTRNGRYRARDFASLVTSTVHTETEVAVVENLLSQVQTALTSYAEPSWAAAHGWPDFADRLLDLARLAEPGSDHQLAYINALGAVKVKERQRSSVLSPDRKPVSVLAALLAITDPDQADKKLHKLRLSKLRLDNDLRWRIVIALASAGVSDADQRIDTQSRNDPSDTGKSNASQARAAQPRASQKETAWCQLMERKASEHGKKFSNAEARALAAGFAAPGHAELLKPYRAQYFNSIVDIWKPDPIALTIATGLYPSWDISQCGIDAADVVLGGCLPDPLRQVILEGQDDVKRALAARAVDANPDPTETAQKKC